MVVFIRNTQVRPIFLISPGKHMLWYSLEALHFFLFLQENICCGTH